MERNASPVYVTRAWAATGAARSGSKSGCFLRYLQRLPRWSRILGAPQGLIGNSFCVRTLPAAPGGHQGSLLWVLVQCGSTVSTTLPLWQLRSKRGDMPGALLCLLLAGFLWVSTGSRGHSWRPRSAPNSSYETGGLPAVVREAAARCQRCRQCGPVDVPGAPWKPFLCGMCMLPTSRCTRPAFLFPNALWHAVPGHGLPPARPLAPAPPAAGHARPLPVGPPAQLQEEADLPVL